MLDLRRSYGTLIKRCELMPLVESLSHTHTHTHTHTFTLYSPHISAPSEEVQDKHDTSTTLNDKQYLPDNRRCSDIV